MKIDSCVKTVLENPTPFKVDLTIKLQDMVMNEIVKKQTELLEVYLLEYCEVNGVKETALKGLLVVGHFTSDNSLRVMDITNSDDVHLGVRYYSKFSPEESSLVQGFDVFGKVLDEKDKYPKTIKFLDSLQ